MAEATEERTLVPHSADRAVALSQPELIEVKGQAWFTHPSFSQNPKSSSEVEDGLLFDDHERLEVSRSGGAECMRVPSQAVFQLARFWIASLLAIK